VAASCVRCRSELFQWIEADHRWEWWRRGAGVGGTAGTAAGGHGGSGNVSTGGTAGRSGVAGNGGSSRVPMIHRTAGSICPTQRGPGYVCTGGTSAGTNECVTDGDCTAGSNGRWFSPNGPGPGACRPTACSYDRCQGDSDCPSQVPCECRASSKSDAANICVAGGNCATDADCGPHGYCSPGAFADYCSVPVYFCHSGSDTCVDDLDCRAIVADSGILQTCNYDSQNGHFACGDACIPPP
jgi:hypothetical protein